MIKKATDLVMLVEEFTDYYLRSPSASGEHLGCDCGCGGDYYTIEEWDEVHALGNKAFDELKQFCIDNNIEFDYT